jgi:hypothetical protein
MLDERRKFERKYLVYFSRVVDRRTSKLLGYLYDLTIQGALVVGEIEFPPDTNLLVRLDLPEGLCPWIFVDIEARVVWSSMDEDGSYKTGLELINTPPESVEKLDCLIDHFGRVV